MVFYPIYILKEDFFLYFLFNSCIERYNWILSMGFMKKRFNITKKMECYYFYKEYFLIKFTNPNELERDNSTNTAFYLN